MERVNTGPLISAIILAAGESKRMGMPKLLMPLGNVTILEQTINNFLNSRVNETIVVLGYQADVLINVLAGKQVKTVINPRYEQGMSTSIIAGIASLDARVRGIMIGLADEPFVDSRTINRLVDEFGKRKKGIVTPLYAGVRGHPVIFDIKYRDDLMKLTGDTGGRQIISQNPDEILEVEVECQGVNQDIDNMATYRLHSGRSGS